MLETQTERIGAASTKIHVRSAGRPISVGSALEFCRGDEGLRADLIDALAAAPFVAYFWETPPVTVSSLSQPFEYVLTDAPTLATASPEVEVFREHFGSDDDHDGIVTFDNLGGDATLVVPCPLVEARVYAHFAAFVRGAPEAQKHALLRRVAEELLRRVSTRPLWLSTAGMGVYWLHVRLDARPKYYRHAPYRVLEAPPHA
jgi:hypothetical protein